MYIELTKFVNMNIGNRPTVRDSRLLSNYVSQGSGGAIYWKVPENMYAKMAEVGGLVRVEGFDNPGIVMASGNDALWGGNFIASGAMQLAMTSGPTRFKGDTWDSVTCPDVETTGTCPQHCAGIAEYGGQQCTTRAQVESIAKSLISMEAKNLGKASASRNWQ